MMAICEASKEGYVSGRALMGGAGCLRGSMPPEGEGGGQVVGYAAGGGAGVCTDRVGTGGASLDDSNEKSDSCHDWGAAMVLKWRGNCDGGEEGWYSLWNVPVDGEDGSTLKSPNM